MGFVKLLQARDDLWQTFSEICLFGGIVRQTGEEERNSFLTAVVVAGVPGVADEFPGAFAHGPCARGLAHLPMKGAVRTRNIARLQRRDQALPVQLGGRWFHLAQFGERGQQIRRVGELSARFALPQLARPRDDRRHADATFEQAEFRSAIRPRGAAAEVGAFFGRVTVVALEDHDGALPQAEFVHLRKQKSNTFVLAGEEGGVEGCADTAAFEALSHFVSP